MIESLFDAAVPPRLPDGPPAAGQATPLRQDVVVDGGALASLRERLARHPGCSPGSPEADWCSRNVALLDPTGLAAGAVLQLLAQASGQPLQELNLRERGTLRTVAVVSRSTLRRPGQPPLQVLGTQLREPGGMAQAFAEALAERADLAVVFSGHLPGAALAALRQQLLAATQRPGGRCPALLFVLPLQRRSARDGLLNADWPAALAVDVLVEPTGQTLALWNGIVAHWEALQAPAQPAVNPPPRPPLRPASPPWGLGTTRAMAAVAGTATEQAAANQARLLAPPPAVGQAMAQTCAPLLARLLRTEGVLACALIDLASARTLAAERAAACHLDATQLDDLARALCAARSAHLAVNGEPPLPDEVLITTGERQTLLRRLPGPRRWGFLALADRGRVNLALLRFSLLDLEHRLQAR